MFATIIQIAGMPQHYRFSDSGISNPARVYQAINSLITQITAVSVSDGGNRLADSHLNDFAVVAKALYKYAHAAAAD